MALTRLAAFSLVGLIAYEWSALLLPRPLLENYCASPDGCCPPRLPPMCDGVVQIFNFLWSVNIVALPLLAAAAVFILLGQLPLFRPQVSRAVQASISAKVVLVAGSATTLVSAAVVSVMVTALISGAWWKFTKFHETSVSVGKGAFVEFLLIEVVLVGAGLWLSHAASRCADRLSATLAQSAVALVLVGIGLYVPFFLSPLAEWRA